jgi:poly-gamma-glutamate synthesis protein (capsule biosynthesis protein)
VHTLFLCGDVMTGRGIDQILRHPGAPTLHEPYVNDARAYVTLATHESGPVPRHVGDAYVWGDALEEIDRVAPSARIANLETSITQRGAFWPKGINYRMHPANVGCLTAARLDACSLANNHVMDFDTDGLVDTLDALRDARIAPVGAGRTLADAQHEVRVRMPSGHDAVIFALGSETSGIPREWVATVDRPGVDLLEDFMPRTAAHVVDRVTRAKHDGDVAIVSIHWGDNWGYDVPREFVRFAHELVEGGVDVVHGHSSHHPRPIEVYRRRLILYGCGDLINDYEGISGHEEYRADLVLAYFPTLEASGELLELRMTALRARRMRLQRASAIDARWLAGVIGDIGERFGTRAESDAAGRLRVRW